MISVTQLTRMLLPALLAATVFIAPPAVADGERAASTREIPRGGRDGQPGDAVRHVYSALEREGERKSRRSATAASKTGPALAQSASGEVWFYDADVQLFNDDDRDGYYWGIDLLFDADTIYAGLEVYAVALLSFEGGPWNEYAITRDFVIDGATSDDEYVIVTELESGYPTGDYDLLIELYDAIDGSFLAEFGPLDTSALSYLPLEDAQRDAPPDTVVVVGPSHGGGAALGLLPLLILPLARWLARGRRARAA